MRLSLLLVFFSFWNFSIAQSPMHLQGRLNFEHFLNENEDTATFSKPYLFRANSFLEIPNSEFEFDDFHQGFNPSKILTHHHLLIKPLLSLSYGTENSGSDFYKTAGGVQVQYNYKRRWHVWSNFMANQEVLPSFQAEHLMGKRAQPYMGASRIRGNHLQSMQLSGAVSFRASDNFYFELGNSGNFIGDGYRSHLLSDFSGPMPYAKITTSFWKVRYHNIFTRMRSPIASFAQIPGNQSSGSHQWNAFSGWAPKFSSMHFLELKLGKRWHIGLFESIVWDARDTLIERGFDLNYLNPIIFYRPVEYGIGSTDNVLIGTSLKFQASENISIYGQFLLDEFLLSAMRADVQQVFNPNDTSIQSGWWANKHSGQLGLKFSNFMGKKQMVLMLEANYSRPFNYTHVNNGQSYTHNGFALAHPLGANYREVLAALYGGFDKWRFQCVASSAVAGLDYNSGNFGGDVLLSYTTRMAEYGNTLTQGIKTTIFSSMFDVSRVIEPRSGLSAFAQIHYNRWQNNLESNNVFGLQLGLRTYLFNLDPFYKLNN